MQFFWIMVLSHLGMFVAGYLFALHPDVVKKWTDAALSKLGKQPPKAP